MIARIAKGFFSIVIAVGLLFGNSTYVLAMEPGRIQAMGDIEARRAAIHLASVKADPRYEQTLRLCQNNFREYGWVVAASATDIFALSTGDANSWIRFFKNRGIAPDVKDLLESEAFQQGLRDCDPDYRVFPKIAAADWLGKFTGLAGSLIVLRMGFLSMWYLGTLGQTALIVPGAMTTGVFMQKGLLVIGFGYLVQHLMKFGQTVASTDKIKSETQNKVDQRTLAIQSGVAKMKSGVADSYRTELIQIESILQDPDLQSRFNQEQIQGMRERAERIRASGILH